MKTISILGNTYGIGHALEKKFSNLGYNIIQLSRQNGFDINENMTGIISTVEPSDIFVNNAYGQHKNIELLYKLYDIWQDKDKIILNISSDASDHLAKKPNRYHVWKEALDNASKQLSYLNTKCKVLNLRPGYVDTPRVEHIQSIKLDPDYLANIAYFMVTQPKNAIIRNLTIGPYPED